MKTIKALAATTIAKIETLRATGLTAEAISKKTRVKLERVQAHLVVPTELSLTIVPTTEVVAEEVNTNGLTYDNVIVKHEMQLIPEVAAPVQKSNKLAEMLNAAKAQNEAVKQAPASTKRVRVTLEGAPKTSSMKDEFGNNRQKRNYETTVRKIVVFTSASLNACFISTNLAYTTKTYEGALTHMRNDLKPQKRVQPIVQASDVKMEIIEQELEYGAALNIAKAAVYDKYTDLNFEMLCVRPRTVTA